MWFDRSRGGVLMPRRGFVPPSLCSIYMATHLAGFGGGGILALYDIFVALGLTANLKLAIDAGDSSSYGGSGQTWTNRATGGWGDFYRGTTSGSEASDPTFNGAAGGLSANDYFSGDGGDQFILSVANPASVNNLHKDNARYALGALLYNAGDCAILATADGLSTGIGFRLSGGKPSLFVVNGGSTVLSKTADNALSTSAWHYVGVDIDENGNGYFVSDGSYNPVGGSNTWSATYSSPSAGAATHTLEIGAFNGSVTWPNGSRIIAVHAHEGGGLTKDNFDNIFALLRGRVGI